MLLLGDMTDDCIDLGCIHKGTLHTCDRCVTGIERVTATDELFGSLGIKHRARVDDRLRAQGHTRRDIGLDNTGHDIDRRTLGSQNHVHTHRTRLLRDTSDRRLYLFAGLHDEVAVLVDDDDDIGQEAVMQFARHEFLGVETTADELVVVVLQVPDTGIHE